jgi:hypothetical protein
MGRLEHKMTRITNDDRDDDSNASRQNGKSFLGKFLAFL